MPLLFKFQYHAQYRDIGSENEICCVFFGKSDDIICPNPDEIAEIKFINIDKLNQDIKTRPENYTPWFILEMDIINKHHITEINDFLNELNSLKSMNKNQVNEKGDQ